MSEIRSGIYRPDQQRCCAACVFGAGEHEPWCTAPKLADDATLCAWRLLWREEARG